MTHPTLKITGFTSILDSGTFSSRGGPREEQKGPEGTQGPPKGAPRCPKAPQGAPMEGFWVPFGWPFRPECLPLPL